MMESSEDITTKELEFTPNMAFDFLVVNLIRQSSSDSVEKIDRGIVLSISIPEYIVPVTLD